jgi:predicted membrane protein
MSDENIITNVVLGYIAALTTASIVSLLAMLLDVYSFTLPVAFGVTTIASVIYYWKYLREV